VMMTGRSGELEVVLGVDTHLEFYVAVPLDNLGRRLGALRVPSTTKGYKELLCWAEEFGAVRCAGVEGTSSYGAGLARYLSAAWWQWRRPRGPSAVTSGATASPTH
jgi:hypothetical protein